ncbi:MAG TPA: hypothetical protein VM911_21220, partial [Pyrinomonadaceae bacterium]|nr:hypothetical protein [Pyrinomonadaceae bacterium]
MNRARAFTPSLRPLVYLTICCALIVALQSITFGQEQSGTSTQNTGTAQATTGAQETTAAGDTPTSSQPAAASATP